MSDDAPAAEATGTADGDGGVDAATLRRYVNYAALAGLVLLAAVAGLQLYLSVSSAITTWVAPEFRSLFRAAFNLAVLLLAAAGVSWQVRRVR